MSKNHSNGAPKDAARLEVAGGVLEDAAAYYRMSDDDQENSIERQRAQVVPYAARHGYRIVREYVDEGIPGDEIETREAFCRMRRDARAGLFKVILCDDKDRFGRFDTIDQGEVVGPLRRAGVRLETVAQGKIDWNSFTGRITDAVLQEAKKMESQAMSRRVLTGLLAIAARGDWPAATAPYGYRVARVDGRRTLAPGDPYHGEVVRWLFEEAAYRRRSLAELQEELYRRGVAPPGGHGRTSASGVWERQTIRRLLRNRAYVGDIVYNQTPEGKYSRYERGQVTVSDAPRRDRRRSAPADILVRENTHKPLVERDLFRRAQEALDFNQKATTPGRRRRKQGEGRYLLTRLLVCGHCGAYLTGRLDHGRRYYYCGTGGRLGRAACPGAFVAEDDVLGRVIGAIKTHYLDAERLEVVRADLRREQEAEAAAGGRAEQLRRRAAALAAKVKKGNENLALLPADRIPGVVETVRAWERERDALAAEADLIESGRKLREMEEAVARAEEFLWRLREALDSSDPADVRAALTQIVDRVELRFTHEQKKQRRRCRLAGGTAYLDGEPVGLCRLAGDPPQVYAVPLAGGPDVA